MVDTKRFALIRSIRDRVIESDIAIRAHDIVPMIEALPLGAFSDEPQGTVLARPDLLDRLRVFGGKGLGDASTICSDSVRVIESMIAALTALESSLALLIADEKCDHAAGICFCPERRALEMARDARAAAGLPPVVLS